MMVYIRILLRYGVGAIFGMEIGEALAGDPDIALAISAIIAAGVEWWYRRDKKKGKPT